MVQKTIYYTIKESDKLLEYISQNLITNEKDRKGRGVVYTPIRVVENMLDKLPKEVWKNPNLLWLDPATGIGNFPIIAYLRLMKGLQSWESNEEKRRKHILEKMLYMVEISKKSVTTLNKIFCEDKYKLNIYPKSFLIYNPSRKFNIIMGNPPYNEGGTGRTTGSRQPLWPKFIDKSLELVDDKGYILFIHPTGWRKPYSTDMQKNIGRCLYEYYKRGSLYYLNLSDIIIPNFPSVDYYVFANNRKGKTTIDSCFNNIKYENIKLDLAPFGNTSFLPSLLNSDIMNILYKVFKRYNKNDNYKIEYDGEQVNKGMRKNKKGSPIVFYYDNDKYIEVKKKLKSKKDYYNKSKIIMTFSGSAPLGSLHPVYYKRSIGSSGATMYYVTDKDITKHINLFKSKLITAIMRLTQYSPPPRNKNDHKLLNMIQIPTLSDNPTESDIYKYYNISKSERKLIEDIVSGVNYDYKTVSGIKGQIEETKKSKKRNKRDKKTKRKDRRRR